jgi:hypothetical protein
MEKNLKITNNKNRATLGRGKKRHITARDMVSASEQLQTKSKKEREKAEAGTKDRLKFVLPKDERMMHFACS